MKYLKKFNESEKPYITYNGELDDDYILYNMKKLHGWGDLSPKLLHEFEDSEYYSGTKINDEYVEEFHKYMTDIQQGNNMDQE